MNAIAVHPALVHLPIGLAVILPLIVCAIAYALWRNEVPTKAWTLAVGLQAILVFGLFGALNSGAIDEAKVRGLVPDASLDAHLAAGHTLTVATLVGLALFLLVYAARTPRARKLALVAAAGSSLVVAGLALNVGHRGGELVYAYGAAQAHTGDAAAASAR